MSKKSRRFIHFAFAAMTAGIIFSGSQTIVSQAKATDNKVKSVKITNSDSYLLINKRQTKKLKVKVSPKSAVNKKVVWKSSKRRVVSVNQKGIIRGRRYGKAYITVRSKDNKKKFAKIRVQVGRKIKAVSLPTKSTELDVGASLALPATVAPSNATKRSISYKSSNSKVAVVSSTGVVSGKSKGSAVITASSKDGSGKKASCKIQVKIPSQKVSVDVTPTGTRLEAGKTITINATVAPSTASNRSVKYSSTNTEIAKVSQLGVVTGVNSGTVSIRIDAADGRSCASVELEVYKVELKDEKLIAHRGYSSIAPENTTAAFQLAVDNGFYGVECDVRKTLDDNFVIMHDADISRMCGYNLDIANLDLDKLKEYEIKAGNNIASYPGLTVPTLEEYLDILAASSTVHPFIELKQEYTLSELKSIVKIVKNKGLLDRAYFISMYKDNLLMMKTITGVNTKQLQYVYGAETINKLQAVDNTVVDWCIENSIDLDSRYTLISASMVSRMHDSGLCVNVWTVNAIDKAFALVQDSCVDMITTEEMLNSK